MSTIAKSDIQIILTELIKNNMLKLAAPKYGEIRFTFQDGKVIDIIKTERNRLSDLREVKT